MPDSEPTSGGWVRSCQRLLGTVVAIFQNRVELFALELEEEKHRLLELLLLAGTALVLGLVALVLFSGVIVFLFPEGARIYVAAGLAVLYSLGTGALYFRIQNRLQSPPFAETINQIEKDVECLTPPK